MLDGLFQEVNNVIVKIQVKRALSWIIRLFPTMISLLIILILAYLLYSLSYYVFVGLPKILNSTILELPITNNIYPNLLQGIIIVASMVFGFYGILLFYTSKRLNKIVDKYFSDVKLIYKSLLFLFLIIPLFFLILSILFSLNGLIYYGITITFTTEQINTGHIPIVIANSSIENITYFNQAKNYSVTAYGYYNKLLSYTQSSIKMIFLSAIFITAILILYLIDIFGAFDYVNSVYKKYERSKYNYFFDILILILMFSIIFYFKAYFLGIELIILFIVSLFIVYLINRKHKSKFPNNAITKNPPSSQV